MNSVVMITILRKILELYYVQYKNSAIEQMTNYWQKCLMETYQLSEEFDDEKTRFVAHGLIKICEIWGEMDEKYGIHVRNLQKF